ncbi:anti-sigma factor [Sphingobium nicotianae]|uniref:Anti-sigma factor n=1 Tax=Sphingobium nicotianae TaxID=2782607 RepID=A0A9X1IQI5_9SPHN|nr:anti-sigma factor [Sphingobium nicotianae]MBT2186732.1 anti-sigma factor [Sphingobium nicotianae]
MADAPLTPEEFDLLAAELALGVLEGRARARALRLQVSDPGFREAVLAWQARFEPLLHGYPDAEAPDLWHAIEQRLPQGSGPAGDRVGTIERRLQAWRRSALAAGALAAGLAAVLLFRPVTPPAPGPQVAQASQPAVAHLGDAGGAHQFAVNYDAMNGELRVRTLKMPQQSALAPELWVIPADNVPRSLGLVSATGSMRMTVSPAMRHMMADGAMLAVTMEQPDGAPHRAPSSTPIATGPINKI